MLATYAGEHAIMDLRAIKLDTAEESADPGTAQPAAMA
jgi:hypothetical protein